MTRQPGSTKGPLLALSVGLLVALGSPDLLAATPSAAPSADAPKPPKLTKAQRAARKALMKGGAEEPPPADGPVTLKLKKIIPVDRWPKGVELTPDGSLAITTNFSDNTLSFIDTKTLRVVKRRRTGASSPVELAFSADGKRGIIPAGWQKSEVLVLDVEKKKIVRRIAGQEDGPKADQLRFPKVAAFSPDGARFYVTYWGSNNVGVYDATTYELLGRVPAGVNPRGIAITPDGKKGYVCNFDTKSNSVTVFRADQAPYEVLKTIEDIPNPRHVVLTKDGRFAYVSRFGGRGGAVKIDTATDEVVAKSPLTGRRGKTLKLSPDERWVFLANFGADTVSVFDAATLTEVARHATGREPCGLSVSADGETLWTTDWEDAKVRVWDIVVREEPAIATPTE